MNTNLIVIRNRILHKRAEIYVVQHSNRARMISDIAFAPLIRLDIPGHRSGRFLLHLIPPSGTMIDWERHRSLASFAAWLPHVRHSARSGLG